MSVSVRAEASSSAASTESGTGIGTGDETTAAATVGETTSSTGAGSVSQTSSEAGTSSSEAESSAWPVTSAGGSVSVSVRAEASSSAASTESGTGIGTGDETTAAATVGETTSSTGAGSVSQTSSEAGTSSSEAESSAWPVTSAGGSFALMGPSLAPNSSFLLLSNVSYVQKSTSHHFQVFASSSNSLYFFNRTNTSFSSFFYFPVQTTSSSLSVLSRQIFLQSSTLRNPNLDTDFYNVSGVYGSIRATTSQTYTGVSYYRVEVKIGMSAPAAYFTNSILKLISEAFSELMKVPINSISVILSPSERRSPSLTVLTVYSDIANPDAAAEVESTLQLGNATRVFMSLGLSPPIYVSSPTLMPVFIGTTSLGLGSITSKAKDTLSVFFLTTTSVRVFNTSNSNSFAIPMAITVGLMVSAPFLLFIIVWTYLVLYRRFGEKSLRTEGSSQVLFQSLTQMNSFEICPEHPIYSVEAEWIQSNDAAGQSGSRCPCLISQGPAPRQRFIQIEPAILSEDYYKWRNLSTALVRRCKDSCRLKILKRIASHKEMIGENISCTCKKCQSVQCCCLDSLGQSVQIGCIDAVDTFPQSGRGVCSIEDVGLRIEGMDIEGDELCTQIDVSGQTGLALSDAWLVLQSARLEPESTPKDIEIQMHKDLSLSTQDRHDCKIVTSTEIVHAVQKDHKYSPRVGSEEYRVWFNGKYLSQVQLDLQEPYQNQDSSNALGPRTVFDKSLHTNEQQENSVVGLYMLCCPEFQIKPLKIEL